jgi:hypothetical protein
MPPLLEPVDASAGGEHTKAVDPRNRAVFRHYAHPRGDLPHVR